MPQRERGGGGKKRRGKKRRGATKDRPAHLKRFPGPRRVAPSPSAPFFFGDCAARACGAPAPPLCCAEPDGRPPRARATAPKPSDFGAVSFPRAARADAPGAAGLACCIDPSPRHPPRRRRELLRCIIPRCFFSGSAFSWLRASESKRAPFPGPPTAPDSLPLARDAAQETKTGSNRKGKRKRQKPDETTREGAKRDSEKPRPKEATTADGGATASQETKNDKRKEKNKGIFAKQGRRRVFPLKMPLGQKFWAAQRETPSKRRRLRGPFALPLSL